MPDATQQRRTTVAGRYEIRCDLLIHARTTEPWLRPRRSQPSEIVWRRCLREWIPPPQLDTGESRVNNYHHPQKYVLPEDHSPEDHSPEDDRGPSSPSA